MPHQTLRDQWDSLKSEIMDIWGRLEEKDLEAIAGDADRLVTTIERRYDISRADAERQFRDWINKYDPG